MIQLLLVAILKYLVASIKIKNIKIKIPIIVQVVSIPAAEEEMIAAFIMTGTTLIAEVNSKKKEPADTGAEVRNIAEAEVQVRAEAVIMKEEEEMIVMTNMKDIVTIEDIAGMIVVVEITTIPLGLFETQK